jgi:hypothetical protein
MNRFVLSLCAAAILTGCASSPKSVPEPEEVFATPAERAYNLGVEHRRIQDCRAELGEGRVAQHRDSVKLLLTSYPANIRDGLKSEFAKGYSTGPAMFHRIPCADIPQLLEEQVACNAAETRRNLKAAANLK